MAITKQDLDNIDDAITAIASGQQAVQVSIGGKLIRYRENQLSDLEALRSRYARRLGLIPGRAYAKQGGRGL